MKQRLSAFAGLLACLLPISLGAATFNVTKNADTADGACDSDCSLREAVIAANAAAGADTIVVPAGTYRITRSGTDDTASLGDFDITESVTINGAGADKTIIDGNQTGRVFDANPSGNAGVAVTMSKIAVINGLVGSVALNGGGIRTRCDLNINESILQNNKAYYNGGAIACDGTSATVVISRSAVLDNESTNSDPSLPASGGGYADIGGGCDLDVVNSTFSGNKTSGYGGAISSYHSTRLFNATITDNTANSDSDFFGAGGGISITGGGLISRNSIVAGNHLPSGTGVDCSSSTPTQSDGYNLIGVIDGCSSGANAFSAARHDLVGNSSSPVNAALAPLGLNGGTTPLHALLSHSPSLDAGDPGGCTDNNSTLLSTDQRGFTRPVGARCDIGAFEQGGCGDGVKDPGEACDDGNAANTDACTSTCELADCGDGFVQAGIEECDDSNTDDGDGCSADCKVEAAATTGDGTTGGTTGTDTGEGTAGDTTGGTTSGVGSGGCSLIR